MILTTGRSFRVDLPASATPPAAASLPLDRCVGSTPRARTWRDQCVTATAADLRRAGSDLIHNERAAR